MCEGDADVQDLVPAALPGGWLQAMDGRVKTVLAAAALVANVAATSPLGPLLLAAAGLALIARAGVPPRTVAQRLSAPVYCAVVALAVQLFAFGQTAVFQVGPLVATEEGLARGIVLASKVLGGTTVVLVLSLTTPVVELLAAATWLRVPSVLIEIAGLIYRYLFLLAEEAARVREAQRARLGYAGWRRGLRSYGQLGGLVLLNAYNRAERVYEAMLLRGYTGELPVAPNPLGRRQLAACGPFALAVAAIFVLGRAL